MNVIDALCRGCGKPVRLLIGSPQVCGNCREEREKERMLERIMRNAPMDLVQRQVKGNRIG